MATSKRSKAAKRGAAKTKVARKVGAAKRSARATKKKVARKVGARKAAARR